MPAGLRVRDPKSAETRQPRVLRPANASTHGPWQLRCARYSSGHPQRSLPDCDLAVWLHRELHRLVLVTSASGFPPAYGWRSRYSKWHQTADEVPPDTDALVLSLPPSE